MKGEGGVHFYDRRVVGYNFMLQTRHWNAAQVVVDADDGIVVRGRGLTHWLLVTMPMFMLTLTD